MYSSLFRLYGFAFMTHNETRSDECLAKKGKQFKFDSERKLLETASAW